jgi:hypothetical protein
MLKAIVDLVRRRNRARLERRALARARGEVPGGWLSRLVSRIRAKNHARLAYRRAQRALLASLNANDTAMLEAIIFLLKSARQDQRARAEADEAMARRLTGIEERIDAGVRLLGARIQAIEGRLPPSRPEEPPAHPPAALAARPSSAAGANGETQRAKPQLSVAGQDPSITTPEIAEPGDKRSRRS